MGAATIGVMVLALAAASSVIPSTAITAHNILHHLNFLPLMMAGMLFGVRGALRAALFAAVVNAPVIAAHWPEWPLDAEDQVVELTIFSSAGLIAGVLADRERAHRHVLERTRQELEKVYVELQASVDEMKKAERLSAVGQLSASLAHEIRNPLASISGAAGILQRGTAPKEFLEDSLEIIQKESQRLNTLLSGFLNFARPRTLRLQSIKMEELVASVVALAGHRAQDKAIELQFDRTEASEETRCDPEQLKQVLLNLLINALDASPVGARAWLRVDYEHDGVSVDVADQGPGISAEVAEHIFEPFFTTRSTGTGLGLAISSMIVSQHGGSLSFYRNEYGGATFRMRVPRREAGNHVG